MTNQNTELITRCISVDNFLTRHLSETLSKPVAAHYVRYWLAPLYSYLSANAPPVCARPACITRPATMYRLRPDHWVMCRLPLCTQAIIPRFLAFEECVLHPSTPRRRCYALRSRYCRSTCSYSATAVAREGESARKISFVTHGDCSGVDRFVNQPWSMGTLYTSMTLSHSPKLM